MAAKDFSQDEKAVLLNALDMLVKSYTRRVVAEKDAEAKAFWQKKVDAGNALMVKVRA